MATITALTSEDLSGIGIGPEHGVTMTRLNEIITQLNANTTQVALNVAALAGASNPFNYVGAIAANTDFPTALLVTAGDVYKVTADVTDDNVLYTNTSQSFLAGADIYWDGTAWVILGENLEIGIVTIVATPYVVVDGVHTILVDTATIAAPVTVTLPALTTARKSRELKIVDVGSLAGTHNISVTPDGTDEIDGVNAAKDIGIDDGAMTIVTDGVAWFTSGATAHALGDGSDHSYIDQDVTNGAAPVFAVTNMTGSAAGIDSDSATHIGSTGADHSYIDQDVTNGAAPVFAVTNMTGSAAGIDSDSATHIGSTGADHSYIDQDVTNGAAPVFAVTNMTGSAAGIDSDSATHIGSTGIDHSYIQDNLVDAVVAVADAPAAATDALMSVQVNDLAGTAIGKVCEVMLYASDTLYAGLLDPNANITIGTVTAGSVLASSAAAGWWLLKTDATGLFAATASNSSDETVYFNVATTEGGHDALVAGSIVRGCIPDDATWAA